MDKLPGLPTSASFSESSFWNLGRVVASINVLMSLGMAAYWYTKKKDNANLAKIPGTVIAGMVGFSAVVLYFSAYYPKIAYLYGVWTLVSAGVFFGVATATKVPMIGAY